MKIKTKLLTLLSTPVIVGGGFAPLFLNQCGNDTEQFQHVFLDNADDMNAYLQDHVKSINTTGVPWVKATDPDFLKKIEANLSVQNFVNGAIYGYVILTDSTAITILYLSIKIIFLSNFLSYEVHMTYTNSSVTIELISTCECKYYNNILKEIYNVTSVNGTITSDYGVNLNLHDYLKPIGVLNYNLEYTGTFTGEHSSAKMSLSTGDLDNISLT